MHRIDSPTAEADTFGTGKDGYTEGDPAAGIPATATTDDWFNAVQEEIARPSEAFGGVLVKTDNHQLMTALRHITGRITGGNLTKVNSLTATYYGLALRDSYPGLTLEQYAVAAGASGAIATSTNGTTWVARTAGSSYSGTFYGAIWSPGLSLYCLVGTGGEIQTAPSLGTGWTKQTPAGGFSGTFRDVGWLQDTGLGTSFFIAVGASGTIQTSSDGITWTARTAGSGYTGEFRKIYCSSNFAVAVGASGEIQTSPNGINWTRRATGSGTLTGVARDAERDHWVVVGNGTTILRSTDGGINWSSASTAPDNSLVTTYADVLWTPTHGWVLAATFYGGFGFALDLVNPTTPVVNWTGDAVFNAYQYTGAVADARSVFLATASNAGIYRSLIF